MSVYQLSYDVKDSERTDNNEFRKKIVKLILVELRPSWIRRPVASTIFFACKESWAVVESKVKQLMANESFYILTEVNIDHMDNRNTMVYSWSPDMELEKNFKKEVEQLQDTNQS